MEPLDLIVDIKDELIIKSSNEHIESNDEIIYISETENKIGLQQVFFELIVLNLPVKKNHGYDENGKSLCNNEMIELLEKYSYSSSTKIDNRWNELKKIKNGTS